MANSRSRPLGDVAPISTATAMALLPFALGYFMSYLLRAINQVIAPDLMAEFELSQSDLGQLTAAYLFAFVLFQIPLGILLDRHGPKRVQIALLVTAALGVGLFAVAQNVWQLTLARGIIGLGLSGCLMACFKANALWLPQSRLALGNATAVAIGAIGFATATAPADWLARLIGWRSLFVCLAAAICAVVALIAMFAPKGGAISQGSGVTEQLKAQRTIFAARKFWRLAPMIAAISGSYIAIQSLWAGRWLVDVAGLARDEAAMILLWMAASFAIGSLTTGLIADAAQRAGIGLKYIIGMAFLVFAAAQIVILFHLPVPPVLGWMLFGFSGQAANLAYADLAVHFGKDMAGRAQTAANMLLFVCATAFQWGIGCILDLFPFAAGGAPAPIAYQTAFLLVLALQAAAFFWYFTEPRRISPRV